MEVTSVSRNKTLTLTYRKYITTNHFQEGAGEPMNGKLDFHSASSLKQQSTPIRHIILIPSQPVFALSP
jgi:hypothetical protein